MYPIYGTNIIDVGGGLNITNDTAPGFWQSLFAKWSRSGLTGAEEAQNEYNALEAQKARQFSAQQAQAQMSFQARQSELARDWQEQMYNQYQSPSAMMRQYKDAGLNPALMFGNAGSGSIPSASTGPSGASGSGVSASGSPLQASSSGLIDSLLSIVKLRSEIDNINADTAQKRSVTTSQDIQNYIADMTKEVSISQAESNLSLTNNQVSKLALEMRELEFNVSTQNLRKALLEADKLLKSSQRESLDIKTAIDVLNKDFQDDMFGIPIPIVAGIAVGGSHILSILIDKFFGRKGKDKGKDVTSDFGDVKDLVLSGKDIVKF